MDKPEIIREVIREVIRSKRQPDKSWTLRLVCGHTVEGFRTKGTGRTAPHRAGCPTCGQVKP